MDMPTPQSIQENIVKYIQCLHILVEGDGQHFFATIVSDEFIDKNRLERHKMVYQALGNRMHAEIHALSIKALTLQEWKNNG